MRLFTAIRFDDTTCAAIAALRDEIAGHAVRGTFPPTANLHLTLVFLGEVADDKVPQVEEIVGESAAVSRPFDIELASTGRFTQRGNKKPGRPREKTATWWVAPSPSQQLMDLQSEMNERFSDAGFDVPDRRFMPHVTLGRRVVLEAGDRQTKRPYGEPVDEELERKRLDMPRPLEQPIRYRAEAASLMRTVFEHGKPTYVEVGRYSLGG